MDGPVTMCIAHSHFTAIFNFCFAYTRRSLARQERIQIFFAKTALHKLDEHQSVDLGFAYKTDTFFTHYIAESQLQSLTPVEVSGFPPETAYMPKTNLAYVSKHHIGYPTRSCILSHKTD